MENSLAITREERRGWRGRGCGERRRQGERWGRQEVEREKERRRERLEMGAE